MMNDVHGRSDTGDAGAAGDAGASGDARNASDASGHRSPGPGTPAGAERLEVVFHGRVQGVFFRATTKRVAGEHDVRGWVANEPDGTVRLVAEGSREELERFLGAVREARRAFITDAEVVWSEAEGRFEDFHIRR